VAVKKETFSDLRRIEPLSIAQYGGSAQRRDKRMIHPAPAIRRRDSCGWVREGGKGDSGLAP